jgi:hypothetical protein
LLATPAAVALVHALRHAFPPRPLLTA